LKRYRCKIDLDSNSLRVNADGKEENIPFLLEKDLHDTARGTQQAELQNNGFPLPAPPASASASSEPTSSEAASTTPPVPPSSSTVTDLTGSTSTSSSTTTTTTTTTTPMDTESATSSAEVATVNGGDSGSGNVGEMGKVQHLMGMGFPEAAVRAALAQADGNVELAAQLLLAMTN